MDEHRPISSIRKEMELLARELAERIAFDEAIALAYRERTGEELEAGGAYMRVDRDRALEIIELYPKPDMGA
jgi:hypothetical protein